MKVAMIVPAYADPEGAWRKAMFGAFLGTLQSLYGFDCTICYNFQHYTRADIKEVLDLTAGCGFKCRYKERRYTKPVSMAKIREHTCRLMPEADIFICADDDFKFSRDTIVDRYTGIVRYMEKHPDCGAVMANGYMGGSTYGSRIVPADPNAWWWTSRGLFLRNVSERWLFCRHDIFDVPGTIEDLYAVYCRYERGYYGAKTFNVPVYHRATNIFTEESFLAGNERKGRYPVDEDIHNFKFFEGSREFVRRRWSDPTWMENVNRKTMPKGLLQTYREKSHDRRRFAPR